jgi:hypothetical protein
LFPPFFLNKIPVIKQENKKKVYKKKARVDFLIIYERWLSAGPAAGSTTKKYYNNSLRTQSHWKTFPRSPVIFPVAEEITHSAQQNFQRQTFR